MKQEMMGWQWHQVDHICKSFAPRSRLKPCQHLITRNKMHAKLLQIHALVYFSLIKKIQEDKKTFKWQMN